MVMVLESWPVLKNLITNNTHGQGDTMVIVRMVMILLMKLIRLEKQYRVGGEGNNIKPGNHFVTSTYYINAHFTNSKRS
jgi:hypothetical protein